MWFARKRAGSCTAEREPMYSDPVWPPCGALGEGGRVAGTRTWCIGVHIAWMTSGGRLSNRIISDMREIRLRELRGK